MRAPPELVRFINQKRNKHKPHTPDNGNGPQEISEEDLTFLYGEKVSLDCVTSVTDVTSVTTDYPVTSCYQDVTKHVTNDVTKSEQPKSLPTRNLTQEVKDWLETCDGNFTLREICSEFRAAPGSSLYNNIKVVLNRLKKTNLIEVVGSSRANYRIINTNIEEINWWDSEEQEAPIVLPLGMNSITTILPGNIVIFAGEQNSSKTALALTVAKDNCLNFPTFYFNSEMGKTELANRIAKFDDVDPQHFRNVKFFSRTDNFPDVIVPNALNIIDYLEIHDEFWKIGGIIRAIHDKIGSGIAVITLQKTKGAELGRGNSLSIEKARLYLSISTLYDSYGKPFSRATITKAKMAKGDLHPQGMVRDFRLYQGAKIYPLSDWDYPKRS